MDEDDIFEALNFILSNTPRQGLRWRLDGSANLRVQGVDVEPQDLDIVTDKAGLKKFSRALGKCCLKDVKYVKGVGSMLKCNVKGVEVEVWNYEDDRLRLDQAKPREWRGLALRVLPLDKAREAYEAQGRTDKVELLDGYLS